MKRYVKMPIVAMAKESSQGVFWIIDGQLLAFPFGSADTYDGIAKSGATYNHKKLWPDVRPHGCNKPYNYYPRGRVEFTNSGDCRIFMNPNVDDTFIPEIQIAFGIRTEPKVIYDNSEHYKCYLDDGWKADR